MQTLVHITKSKRVRTVEPNPDGTILVRELIGDELQPVSNPGMFILSCGGVTKLINMCIPVEGSPIEYAKNYFAKLEAEKARQRELSKQIKEKINDEIIRQYKELPHPIPATVDNIRIVGRWLALSNWGSWSLPQMSIGYTAHQYNCDGKTAVTITLDEGISDTDMGIVNKNKFAIGAPIGHLSNYQHI